MRTAHISGHWDLTKNEFHLHYRYKILEAFKRGDNFVVGDCEGADRMAINLLTELGANVTVFHMHSHPRFNISSDFQFVRNFRSADACDEAMTAASDYDIAWIRPGKENSNTAKNLLRRSQSIKE